jgi:hypothetical protein
MTTTQEINQTPVSAGTQPNYEFQSNQRTNLLVLILSIAVLAAVASLLWMLYQNQLLIKQLDQQVQNNGSHDVALISPTESAVISDSDPISTQDWNFYTNDILNIEYKLPPKLGLVDLSGQEISGEVGTQYCAIYLGDLAHSLVKTVYAGSGACGGGTIVIGAVSLDYEVGRNAGFADAQGYLKENDQYSLLFPGGKKYVVPADLVTEVTNDFEVEYIKIRGQEQTLENMSPAIPAENQVGAVFNSTNLNEADNYAGFTIQINLNSNKDEEIFDQILETFRLI